LLDHAASEHYFADGLSQGEYWYFFLAYSPPRLAQAEAAGHLEFQLDARRNHICQFDFPIMDTITFISPRFAVTSALGPDDFQRIAALGFRAVINNRPDGEENAQPDGKVCKVYAAREGLGYHHVPASMSEIFTDPVVSAMTKALASESGPVLAYCKSGLRSAIIWAAAQARSVPVDDVLRALQSAGLELEFLRDDLDRQADRAQWMDAKGSPFTSPDAVVPLAAT